MKLSIKNLLIAILILGQSLALSAKPVIKQLSALNAKKARGKRTVLQSNLDSLNPLVFQPTDSPQGKCRTIIKACKNIEEGSFRKNEGSHVTIHNRSYNLSCQIPSGLTGTICIFVSGYSGKFSGSLFKYKGSGAYAVFRHLRKEFMTDATWISFDGPVSFRKTFNFGQELDQSCLHEIYTRTVENNPCARIIFVGLCKGATTILNYLNNPSYKDSFAPVKAIVLESPLISFETCTKKIARTKLPKPLGRILPRFFKAAFPNYVWNQPTIHDDASHFPGHIKTFIGCSRHDPVAPYEDSHKIATSLERCAICVELFEQHDKAIAHGHLAKVRRYQQKVINFLATA
ncbi:MAG: hypothetical protein IT346_00310 [Epsilonproteobacteria bacterium]|nr:hypothetical protein [Campylobacterota bacterium]